MATSSNASKSKYIDEAPPDVVSVMTTPSRFHIVSVRERALADEARLLAALVAADVDAVDNHAGHGLEHRPRIVRLRRARSSAVVSVVDVPVFLTSTTGEAAVTVTVSSTALTASVNGI